MDDLAEAQARLGRALARARAGAGAERGLGERVREAGERFLQGFVGLLRLSRVHAADNRAFEAPAAELAAVLSSLIAGAGPVRMVAVEEQVYVNDLRVRPAARSGHALAGELKPHNTGGLTFHAPLDAASLRRLVAALAAPPAPVRPRSSLAARLAGERLGSVELVGIHRYGPGEGAGGAVALEPTAVLEELLALADAGWGDLAAGRVIDPAALRRGVSRLLEVGVGAPALWARPAGGQGHAAHAVEVTVIALLVGGSAGLSPGALQDLGAAALIHDAGYLLASAAGGGGGLARHALDGARLAMRQRGFSAAKVRRLRAILEHHRDHADPAGRPSALGAILRIAEDYTNLIRLYGAKVTRAEALGAMARAGGTLYDPVLVQALVNGLGLHPPGALVEIDDGRTGRVVGPARSPDLWDRPLVRILEPSTGRPTDDTVDLAVRGRIWRDLPG